MRLLHVLLLLSQFVLTVTVPLPSSSTAPPVASCRLQIGGAKASESLDVRLGCSGGASVTLYMDSSLVPEAAEAAESGSAPTYPGVRFRDCSWPHSRCLIIVCGESHATFDRLEVAHVNSIDLDAVVCFSGNSTTEIRNAEVHNISEALAVAALLVTNSSTLVVLDGTFTQNRMTGLQVEENGTAHVNRSNFMNNTLVSALWASGRAHVVLNGCVLANNTALPAGSDRTASAEMTGTALYAGENASVHINGSQLYGNRAESGGCIYLQGSASLVLAKSSLSGNNASQAAGAIYAMGESKVIIQDTVFDRNHAGRFAGAIIATENANLSIDDSQIIRNTAGEDVWGGGGYGGGVMLQDNANMGVRNTLFDSNDIGRGGDSEGWGGGVYACNNATLHITNCNFTNQGKKESYPSGSGKGGAVHAKDQTRVVITGTLFSGNELLPLGVGAGVLADNTANITVDGCTFIANRGFKGGGVHAEGQSFVEIKNSIFRNQEVGVCCGYPGGKGGATNVENAATMVIRNSSFFNNTVGAEGLGGAVSAATVGSLNVTHSNFTSNFAGDAGGGIAIKEYRTTVHFHDCILEGNQARRGGGLFVSGVAYDEMVEDEHRTRRQEGSLYPLRGSCSMSKMIIMNSSAAATGGALHMEGGFGCSISDSIITNNR